MMNSIRMICLWRYPGPDYASGSLKIPTMLYYDKGGNVKAAGAECMTADIEEQAEDEEWTKVEWCASQYMYCSTTYR